MDYLECFSHEKGSQKYFRTPLNIPLINVMHNVFSHFLTLYIKGLKTTQLTFTCSKSTIETLGKGVKYVQS